MVDGQVAALGEAHAEQLARHVEGRGDDAVELQIGLDLEIVDIEGGLAHLLGVVAPVPRGELEVAAFGLCGLLQLGALLARAGARRPPYLHQQLAHGRGRLRHRELERRLRRRLEAQQPRPLGAQTQDLSHDLAVVRLAAVGAAHDPGVERLLAQIAPGGILQERLDAGARQRDGVLALVAALARRLRRGRPHRFGQTGKVRLALQHQHERLLVGQQVLAEVRAEHGHARGNRRQPLLGAGREAGAGLDEGAVIALQHAALLLAQARLLALLEQGIDTGKQRLVLVDAHPVLGEARRHRPLDGLDLLVGVGGGQVEEHGGGAVEDVARMLEGGDGVGERRRRRVAGNGRDRLALGGKALLECRHEMLDFDAIERRHLERRGPGPEQRVLPGCTALRRFGLGLGCCCRTRPFRRRRFGFAGCALLRALAHDDGPVCCVSVGWCYGPPFRRCRDVVVRFDAGLPLDDAATSTPQ